MQQPFKDLPTFSVSVGKSALWIILIVFFIGYATISAILIYHWRKYGMSNGNILIAESLFLTVSVILFGIAFFALTIF